MAARAKARVAVRMAARVAAALALALAAPVQEELLEWSWALWASVASAQWLAALMSPRTIEQRGESVFLRVCRCHGRNLCTETNVPSELILCTTAAFDERR